MRVIFHGRRALLGSALMLHFDWDAEPSKKHEDEETEWSDEDHLHPEKKTAAPALRCQSAVRGGRGGKGVQMRDGAPCMDCREDTGGCGWMKNRVCMATPCSPRRFAL